MRPGENPCMWIRSSPTGCKKPKFSMRAPQEDTTQGCHLQGTTIARKLHTAGTAFATSAANQPVDGNVIVVAQLHLCQQGILVQCKGGNKSEKPPLRLDLPPSKSWSEAAPTCAVLACSVGRSRPT